MPMDNTLIIYSSNHGTVDKCARELFKLMEGIGGLPLVFQRDTELVL
jgi:menaquinone-dependent protoporphyrinogen IX oxidase